MFVLMAEKNIADLAKRTGVRYNEILQKSAIFVHKIVNRHV